MRWVVHHHFRSCLLRREKWLSDSLSWTRSFYKIWAPSSCECRWTLSCRNREGCRYCIYYCRVIWTVQCSHRLINYCPSRPHSRKRLHFLLGLHSKRWSPASVKTQNICRWMHTLNEYNLVEWLRKVIWIRFRDSKHGSLHHRATNHWQSGMSSSLSWDFRHNCQWKLSKWLNGPEHRVPLGSCMRQARHFSHWNWGFGKIQNQNLVWLETRCILRKWLGHSSCNCQAKVFPLKVRSRRPHL